MSPSFSCVSPKDWWLSSTRRVGLFKDAWGDEAKFSPSLSLSVSLRPSLSSDDGATSARGFPQIPASYRPPSNQTASSKPPPPALVRMAECDVWRSASRQCDKWCRWATATHKRTKKAGSHRYDDALNQQGERSLMLSTQCAEEKKKDEKSLKGKLLALLLFYKPEVKRNCMKETFNSSHVNILSHNKEFKLHFSNSQYTIVIMLHGITKEAADLHTSMKWGFHLAYKEADELLHVFDPKCYIHK